ncbi:MAG: hypothetical protein PUG68_08170 [Lachnospiraceae bacterium]|nr:hypothetical protein [Lachnospiraceae bacterium]MDD7327754.1 hypothetical protein [Lachnospiraceae bacterium]MDY2758814.1 hypothetical protein [Lachnospiraceae bacterium]
MLDFDEELKNFRPSMEINEAEDAIRDTDLTDMIDILKEITTEQHLGSQTTDSRR